MPKFEVGDRVMTKIGRSYDRRFVHARITSIVRGRNDSCPTRYRVHVRGYDLHLGNLLRDENELQPAPEKDDV